MKHAKEPWVIGGYGKVYPADCQHEPIIVDGFCLAMSAREEAKANTERIVQCVNACAGIADPEKAIPSAKEWLTALVERHDNHAKKCNFESCGCQDCGDARTALRILKGERNP